MSNLNKPLPTRRSRLLELPLEVRVLIFENLLVAQGPMAITVDSPRSCEAPELHLQSSLLRTCKIIHEEGANVLYASNTFETPGHTNKYLGRDLNEWLAQIGNRNVARLKSLSISLSYPPFVGPRTFPKRGCGSFHVELTIRLHEPQTYESKVECRQGFEVWTAELEHDRNVERQMEEMFGRSPYSNEPCCVHDIMSIYVVAMRFRAFVKSDHDIITMPTRAAQFLEPDPRWVDLRPNLLRNR